MVSFPYDPQAVNETLTDSNRWLVATDHLNARLTGTLASRPMSQIKDA